MLNKHNLEKKLILKLMYESKQFDLLILESTLLLEFHLILLNLFNLKNDTYSNHLFKQRINIEHPYYFNVNEDIHQAEYIHYQLVEKEECDGWLIEFAPGTYLEHSNPFEINPTFNINNEEKTSFYIRQLRDERSYQLKQCFDNNKSLEYEYETYDEDDETKLINIKIELIDATFVTTTESFYLLSIPLIINYIDTNTNTNNILTINLNKKSNNQLKLSKKCPIKNQKKPMLNLLINNLKKIKMEQFKLKQLYSYPNQNKVCLICHHFDEECWLSNKLNTCSHYQKDIICCNLCPANNLIMEDYYFTELEISKRWYYTKLKLMEKRIQFLKFYYVNNNNNIINNSEIDSNNPNVIANNTIDGTTIDGNSLNATSSSTNNEKLYLKNMTS